MLVAKLVEVADADVDGSVVDVAEVVSVDWEFEVVNEADVEVAVAVVFRTMPSRRLVNESSARIEITNIASKRGSRERGSILRAFQAP